jgi:hypothetical protein
VEHVHAALRDRFGDHPLRAPTEALVVTARS